MIKFLNSLNSFISILIITVIIVVGISTTWWILLCVFVVATKLIYYWESTKNSVRNKFNYLVNIIDLVSIFSFIVSGWFTFGIFWGVDYSVQIEALIILTLSLYLVSFFIISIVFIKNRYRQSFK